MRTLHEYEPGDIKLDGFAEGEEMDPVISFLLAEVIIIGLTGFKPRPGDDKGDVLLPAKRIISGLLNHAAKSGISITKSEVPSEFTRAFDAGFES